MKTAIVFEQGKTYECSCCLRRVSGREAIKLGWRWTHHDKTPNSDGEPVDLCHECKLSGKCCE